LSRAESKSAVATWACDPLGAAAVHSIEGCRAVCEFRSGSYEHSPSFRGLDWKPMVYG